MGGDHFTWVAEGAVGVPYWVINLGKTHPKGTVRIIHGGMAFFNDPELENEMELFWVNCPGCEVLEELCPDHTEPCIKA